MNLNENNQETKKKIDFSKYLNIVLIGLLLFVVIHRFALPALGQGRDELAEIGLQYYVENYGTSGNTEGLKSVVKDYGCHKEIHIYEKGELVMRLSYFNGSIYEL